MPPDEFDNYLTLVTRLLRLNHSEGQAMGDELRDHLENRITELTAEGQSVTDAKRQALEEFGDAASLAQRFQLVFQSYRRRWMMRFTTMAIAGSFLVVVMTFALWPEQSRFGAPSLGVAQDDGATTDLAEELKGPSLTTRLNDRTNEVLEKPVSFDYDETPFAEVMMELSEEFGLNVLLHQSARDDSLTADEPVSFSIRDLRLRKALALMLMEKNATFVVEEGVLMIISMDVSYDYEFLERDIIDVRSLLEQIRNSGKSVKGSLGGALPSAASGGGVSGMSGSGGSGHRQGDNLSLGGGGLGGGGSALKTQLGLRGGEEQQVLDLIYTCIDPDSWTTTNGSGTLSVVGGLIVITNTRETIQRTKDLIRDLEYRFAR